MNIAPLEGYIMVDRYGKPLYNTFTKTNKGGKVGWIKVSLSLCFDFDFSFSDDFNSAIRIDNIPR